MRHNTFTVHADPGRRVLPRDSRQRVLDQGILDKECFTKGFSTKSVLPRDSQQRVFYQGVLNKECFTKGFWNAVRWGGAK